MRSMNLSFALILFSPSLLLTVDERNSIKSQFKSKNYSVTWGEVSKFPATSELEVGNGSGHGFYLWWLRFKPTKDRIDVLSIRLDENRKPYHSKWPPDNDSIVVKRASMTFEEYASLLNEIAVADSAKLSPVDSGSAEGSSSDLWVSIRLTEKNKSLVDWDWAGYLSSHEEIKYAKPKAAFLIVYEAFKKLDAK